MNMKSAIDLLLEESQTRDVQSKTNPSPLDEIPSCIVAAEEAKVLGEEVLRWFERNQVSPVGRSVMGIQSVID